MFSVHTKTQSRRAFSSSSGLKSVFEKLRFRVGLVWTEGQTVKIKLCFRDGLVWAVLTVEIELRIQISLAGVHGAFVSCYLCNKMFFFHIVKIYLKLISQNIDQLTIAHFIDNIFSIFSTFAAI